MWKKKKQWQILFSWAPEIISRLPRWHWWSEPACQCRRHKRHGFDPWVGKIPWRKWLTTPVFLPGEARGQRSLVGYSLYGHKESDTTEVTVKLDTTEMIYTHAQITMDGDCSHEIKRRLLLGRKSTTNLDSVWKKQGRYFANKSPYSHSCGFSTSYVWMWALDHK